MEKGYSEADYAMGDRIKTAMHSRKITVPMMAKDLHYSEVTILRIRRRGVRSVDAVSLDRKSTRLNSSHRCTSRMPSSA